MASMYGGQAAEAGVKGYQQGYNFRQQAEAAHQDAQLKEQRIKEAVIDNKLLNIAYDDVAGPSQQENEMSQLKQTVQKQEQTIKKSNATTVQKNINELARQDNNKDRSAVLQATKTRFKTNPEIYEALGIKNVDTMQILNPSDPKDRQWMKETLMNGTNGPEESDLTPEVIAMAMETYPAIKADGAIIDLQGLSAATGAASMANPEHTKIMEKNLKKLRTGVYGEEDRMATNVEKGLSGSDEFIEKGQTASDVQQIPIPESTNDTEALNKDLAKETAKQVTQNQYGYKKSNNEIDSLVDKLGLKVKGGFRDEQHNKDVGGAKTSQHTVGEAYDIDISGKSTEEVNQIIREAGKLGFTSFGTGTNSLHIDRRANPASWGYAGGVSSGSGPAMSKYSKAISEAQADAKQFGKNVQEAQQDIKSQVAREITTTGTAPLSDMKMRKVYALLGKTYPKDPNEPTTKMRNYEYLRDVVGDDKAYNAIFGGSSGSKTTLEKLEEKYNEAVTRGDTESAAMYKKAMGGEAGKYTQSKSQAGMEKYHQTVKDLKDKENKSPEDIADLKAAEEAIFLKNNPAAVRTGIKKSEILTESEKKTRDYLDKAVKGDKLDEAGVQALKDAEMTNENFYSSSSMKTDRDLVGEMEDRQTSINSMTSLYNDLRDESKDISKYEQGPIDNLINLTSKIVEPEYIEALDKQFGSNWKERAVASVDKNSRAGYIQAQFIKAMSGTAASDKEREFLVDVMQSGQWNQPEFLEQSLKTFVDMMKEENRTKHSQADKLPNSAYQATQYTEMGGDSKTGTNIGDTYKGQVIINRNPATGEIQLADGSVVKA